MSVLYGSSSPSIAMTQSSCQPEFCPEVFPKASLSCASTQSSGVDLRPWPFVKQTSSNAFLGLERYLTLPWAPEECGSLHVVQQWSTSKADMVNYLCKALKTEREWECRALQQGLGGVLEANVRSDLQTVSVPVLLLVTWPELCNKGWLMTIASITNNEEWGREIKKRGDFSINCLTSSKSIALHLFFSPTVFHPRLKGNLLPVVENDCNISAGS